MTTKQRNPDSQEEIDRRCIMKTLVNTELSNTFSVLQSCLLCLLLLISFVTVALADTITVKNTNDSGPGSLRDVIIKANADCGMTNIKFDISGPPLSASDGNETYYYYSIQPTSPLPDIVCPVNINGFSQKINGVLDDFDESDDIDDFSTNDVDMQGQFHKKLPIELSGQYIWEIAQEEPVILPQASWCGLRLIGRAEDGSKNAKSPDGSTIRGMVINRFPHAGIYVYGTDHVKIKSNFLGVDVTGESGDYSNGWTGAILHGGIGMDALRVEASKFARVKRNLIVSGFSGVSFDHLNESTNNPYQCDPSVCGNPALDSSNGVISFNRIGVDKDAENVLGPLSVGSMVFVTSSDDTKIHDNIIANATFYMWLQGQVIDGVKYPQTGVQVYNNFLGTDITGTQNLGAGNEWGGLAVAAENTQCKVENNLIRIEGDYGTFAFNGAHDTLFKGNQVFVTNKLNLGFSTGGMSIFQSEVLPVIDSDGITFIENKLTITDAFGIEFNTSGLTGVMVPNDYQDVDNGGNNFQNFPLLASAQLTGSDLEVSGSLNSNPNQKYRIDFYANSYALSHPDTLVVATPLPEVYADNFSASEFHLGYIEVDTDSNGNVSFNTTVNGNNLPECVIEGSPQGGSCITATATKVDDPATSNELKRYGDTSQFSPVIISAD